VSTAVFTQPGPTPESPEIHCAQLRERAAALVAEDRLEAAAVILDEAVGAARASGDPELLDRTLCNRAAVAIELGRGDGELQQLREILLAQRSPAAAFLAAYNLAEAHQIARQHRKALFYAQIAEARARATGRSPWVASSLNRLGNLHVAVSQLDAARDCYLQAAKLVEPGDASRALPILQNIGYVDALEGNFPLALERLYQACRGLRNAGTRSALIHLDLAWTLLQVGRPLLAARHAGRALNLAAENRPETRKAALLLATQAAREAGRDDDAADFGAELSDYYPAYGQLSAIVGAVNLLPVVNLRA
jgi:tetratricopeptide (TPR) repeat protein